MKVLSHKLCAFSFLLILILSGCGDGNSLDENVETPPLPPQARDPFLVSIVSSSSDSIVSEEFQLEANLSSSEPDAAFSWTTSDGQSFSGEQISVAFSTEGFFDIQVRASTPDGRTALNEISLIVHDPADPTPDFLDLPDIFSDFNGDGIVNLSDVLGVAQQSGGLLFNQDQIQALSADLDLNNEINSEDVRLIASAFLDNAPLPTDILADNELMPGTFVTVVSPELLDATRSVTATVDGREVAEVVRVVLGYATFSIPPDVFPGEEVDFVLSLDGAPVVTLQRSIEALPTLPATPQETFTEFVDLVEVETAVGIAAVELQFGTGAILDGYTATAEANLTRLREIEAVLLIAENSDLTELVVNTMLANGLDKTLTMLRQTSQSISKSGGIQKLLGPDEICDVVDGICSYKNINIRFRGIIEAASTACLAAPVATLAIGIGASRGLATPASIVAAVGTITSICIPLEAGLIGNEAIVTFLDPINFKLALNITDTSDPNVFNLNPQVRLLDNLNLCAALASSSSQAVQTFVADAVGDIIEGRIKRKIPFYEKLKDILDGFSGDDFQTIEDLVQESAGSVLDGIGVINQLEATFSDLCSAFSSPGGELLATVSAANVIQPIDPINGTLVDLPDGTADLMCAPPASASTGPNRFFITARKELCDGTETINELVACSPVNVTITFGDNGSANDDIFEVRVAGRVFTSENPERMVVGSVQLASGSEVEVEMFGRAAPDGIGTYFISFQGARVIAGDATSGNDLTPGRVKRFTILVD